MSVHFEPPFAPIQTTAFVAGAIAAAFVLYTRVTPGESRRGIGRRRVLLALRLAVMAAFALLLLNPVVRAAGPNAREKSPFLLLMDTSRSMETPDGLPASSPNGESSNLTRLQAAKRLVFENAPLWKLLTARYHVHSFRFAGRAEAGSPEALRRLDHADGNRTEIGAAILQAVDTVNTKQESAPNGTRGALLLVSDGRDNGSVFPLDAAHAAKAAGFPVYTLCLGRERKNRDLSVTAQRPQVFGAPGQTIELTAEIRDTGIDRATVQVDLLREGRRIASRRVTVAPGRRAVTFPVQEPRKGFTRYAVVCSVAPGETNVVNNRAGIFLNVLDTRTRVLLLEGSPSWDSKFLSQTLRADPTVTLDSIYQLTDNRPFALSGSPDRPTLSVPRTVDDFARYDVVILGKGYEAFFDAAATEALKKWVAERGGSVVFLRGRPDENTPALKELEPVTFGDREIESAQVRLTEAGRSHPGFAFSTQEDAQTVVQKLPALISATQVQGERALAVVLARTQTGENADDAGAKEMALIAYQRYGQGKSVAIIGQGLWQWAFLPPELSAYSNVYDEFWTQTIRWLVSESDFLPGQEMALHTDRTAYDRQETVTFLGRLRGPQTPAPPTISLLTPAGKTLLLATARADGKTADFTASFHPQTPGEYVATVPPPPGNPKAVPVSAAFTVYPGQQEDANRSADPELMRQIAADGGGQALTAGDLPTLPERLRAAERASRAEEPQTLWDRGWVLAVLIGLLTTEWLLRRRFGLA